jgi:hypothetical protein
MNAIDQHGSWRTIPLATLRIRHQSGVRVTAQDAIAIASDSQVLDRSTAAEYLRT